ncbi:tetratricopeptide repeat protein [Burkholderia gladioli]|uniref:tetratricopeptide repeat protein n=1 Tax=Burkholderia gladioli TaxID=28095 RepID=UPI00163F6E78|nr:tetratricopeptide repeat protein [Burkholderia gladioli]
MKPALADTFGQHWHADDPATLERWNRAIRDYFTFRGNPVGDALALSNDAAFVMGDVFALSMLLFDGEPKTSPRIAPRLRRLAERFPDATEQEQGHIRAVQACAEGEITRATEHWQAVLEREPGDLLAMKLAHEAHFLVGDAGRMLDSMRRAMRDWRPDQPGYGFVLGQYAFALEENGHYAAAEGPALLALERERDDCWALHALIHVHEMQNRHDACLALLDALKPRWSEQPLLLAHIWWHLALRYVAARRYDEALAIHDAHLASVDAASAFRLTDGTSLLWRLELAGQDVGERWQLLADKWLGHAERHGNGFLDVHIAMAFAGARRTDELRRFLDGFDQPALAGGASELDQIRRQVTAPVCAALAAYGDGDDAAACEMLGAVLPALHRIGGSNAQRDLFKRTLAASQLRAGKLAECRRFLLKCLDEAPNTTWVLDELARVEERAEDPAMASHYRAWARLTIEPLRTE